MKRVIATALLAACAPLAAQPIVVASKNFTESYILGEAVAQLLEQEGFVVDRKLGLGGTKICYDALTVGDIDVYVEYTGTIAEGIKDFEQEPTLDELAGSLAPDGIVMLDPLGFNNTYAIAMASAVATSRNLRTVSDLVPHADLRLAVTHEFLERNDGWPGLRRVYGFEWTPAGIEHALAYQAIADGAIDGTDAYSTDGELSRDGLVVLEDDRGFFPTYLAVPLVRASLDPRAKVAIDGIAGTLNNAEMRDMNAAALAGTDTAQVAAEYLERNGLRRSTDAAPVSVDGFWTRLARNTARHLQLVAYALIPAMVVAVLLAVAIFKIAWLAGAAVYLAGLLQTIPSIALLALLIPLTGIGIVPAVVALFLYALLPILRNAVTALTGIDPTLRRVALAMGLKPFEELRHVFVPLAMPSIVAGVRTAAVISIGTATLAAFIGAGGLGDPIVKGLSLNDTRLILEGAVPAALLAIVTELVFEGIQRLTTPGHLRVAAT